MTSFVDTSALLALFNAVDPEHPSVRQVLAGVDAAVTHNYVVVETEALLRRRLGAAASARFLDLLGDLAEVRWVDRDLHGRAVQQLAPRSRRASLVDQVSFAFMRDHGLDTAIALDDDFVREGFRTLP